MPSVFSDLPQRKVAADAEYDGKGKETKLFGRTLLEISSAWPAGWPAEASQTVGCFFQTGPIWAPRAE